MSRVIHFEFSANNPEKAVNFYKNVFGWDIKKWDSPEDYWLITTGEDDQPGINGGIFRPKEQFTGTVNSIAVDSVDEFMAKIPEKGGNVVTEKMTIPNVGYLAYCHDPEGNLFGITQFDPSVE